MSMNGWEDSKAAKAWKREKLHLSLRPRAVLMFCAGQLFEGHPIAAHPAVLIFSFCASLFFPSILICHTLADYHQRQRLLKHDKKRELNEEECAKLLILICKERWMSRAWSLHTQDRLRLHVSAGVVNAQEESDSGMQTDYGWAQGCEISAGGRGAAALALIYDRPEGRAGPGHEPRGYRVTGHRVPMSRSLFPRREWRAFSEDSVMGGILRHLTVQLNFGKSWLNSKMCIFLSYIFSQISSLFVHCLT